MDPSFGLAAVRAQATTAVVQATAGGAEVSAASIEAAPCFVAASWEEPPLKANSKATSGTA